MKLAEIKEKVSREEWILPPFQREFVWNEEKRIIEFVESVFNEWPIGGIILWVPNPKDEEIIKKRKLQLTKKVGKPQYIPEYIIDGQQRLTTLLRLLDNDSFTFHGEKKILCYDFYSEKFVFRKSDELKEGELPAGDVISRKYSEIKTKFKSDRLKYDVDERIEGIKRIKDYDVTIQRPRKEISMKEAQELFIRLNTGGKQLPSVDLALAYISLLWDDSRDEFKNFRSNIERTGFYFDIDFFVRCLSAISLKQSLRKKLIRSFKADTIKEDWKITKDGIEKTIDFLKGTLNLNSNLFLEAENTLVPIVLLFSKREETIKNKMDLLAYWFVVAYVNQRFSGQSTLVLNRDIKTILESKDPVNGLINNLKEDKSLLTIEPKDIKGKQFRFILYCLFKSLKTRDFVTGFGIETLTASKTNKLDLHHIFAKSLIERKEIEDVANKTFLTNKSNKKLSASDPTYLSNYSQKLLKAHLIPIDKSLWKISKYDIFLIERKKLISKSLNHFLNELKKSGI